jgi:amidase
MSNPEEICFLDVAEIGKRLRHGAFSSVELTEWMLARIRCHDSKLRAYAWVTEELAIAQAHHADDEISRGTWRGPLHGVPVGVKDLFATRDIPTGAGMPLLADFRPSEDSTVVRRLQDAGAILLGKLQLTEGAVGDHHPLIQPPLNPWDENAWPGASSSGSGVAVAAGLCFAALSSDTGGSIRFPSAANGVTGLKPSWGRVSRKGVFALSEPLDCMGPIARTAKDAALVLSAVAGIDPFDPTSSPAPVPDLERALIEGISGFRIGVDPLLLASTDASTAKAVDDTMKVLESLGAQRREVRLPNMDEAADAWWTLCSAGAAHTHRELYPTNQSRYGPSLTRAVEHGRGLAATDVIPALVEREKFRAGMDELFLEVDLLLVPVQAFAAPSLQFLRDLSTKPRSRETLLRFVAPFALSGQPVLVVPAGQTPAGLPVGVQLVGPFMREDLVLRAGHAFQGVTAWHLRRPAALRASGAADPRSAAQ